MFGSAPRQGDQTGIQPDNCQSNNPHDNTKFILEKIDALDKRLTKQITCKHGNFKYEWETAISRNESLYRKICGHCGLNVNSVDGHQKLIDQLKDAESEVERLKAALERDYPQKD